MKKAETENKNDKLGVLNYRNTPLTGIDASPTQLLMSRRLRSKNPRIAQ